MEIPQKQGRLKLTHVGRRSGKVFQVTIWFAVIDGGLWIGSLDKDRNWVRNLRSAGGGRVDFGAGPVDVTVEEVTEEAGKARYRAAVAAKYPIASRIIALMVRGKTPAAFRVNFADRTAG